MIPPKLAGELWEIVAALAAGGEPLQRRVEISAEMIRDLKTAVDDEPSFFDLPAACQSLLTLVLSQVEIGVPHSEENLEGIARFILDAIRTAVEGR